MVTIISRVIHYGFKNFWRNGLLSTATTAIVTLSLIVFAGLIFANATTTSIVNFLKDKIDVSVYFQLNTPEDEILNVQESLRLLPEVKAVEYLSAEQALQIFKERHKDEPDITQSLEQLNSNPFEASLDIKAYDPGKYAAIADYLNNPDLRQYVDKVNYFQNQKAIDNLAAIVKNVDRAGLLITIFLSLIAGLVVFNTIRLVIYSNRDEISIMRAVGASNAFVRGPYVVEGILIGLIAAIISLILILLAFLISPFVYSTSASFDVSIPGFSITSFFYQNFFKLLLYQVLFGVLLTSISSFFAVRRYLKN
jgi:cell division transport system permease protein